jgi:hypothetical protein
MFGTDYDATNSWNRKMSTKYKSLMVSNNMDWKIIFTTLLISILAVSTWLGLLANYNAIKGGESLSTSYSAIGATGNTIVSFIIILVATLMSDKGNFYKVFLMLILIGGIISEIYLISTDVENKNKDGIYSVMIINFIIRLYYILDITPTGRVSAVDAVREVVSDIAKQPRAPFQQPYRPPQQAGKR